MRSLPRRRSLGNSLAPKLPDPDIDSSLVQQIDAGATVRDTLLFGRAVSPDDNLWPDPASYLKEHLPDMWTKMPTRLATLALLSATALLHAQNRVFYPTPPRPVPPVAPAAQTLPATAPTTAAPADTQPAMQPAEPAPLTPAQSPARRATVSYTDGQLSVSATNASLNQILRDVSRSTGIKITGGVADERVFGEYGPAPASQVLAALLDGTGSNMLLLQGSGDRASELILTPRTGGPTPPNPNSASFDSNGDSDDAPRQVASPQPPGSQPPGPQSPAAQSQPSQPAVAGPSPNADGSTNPTTPASGDSTQQSPNGVKTPQQIYDELMRMRQQQQRAQPPQ